MLSARRVVSAVACATILAAGVEASSIEPDLEAAFERAKIAEAEGRHSQAFEAYLESWHDPELRVESARRARALERIARFRAEDDLSSIEPLQEKLGSAFVTYRSRSFLVLSDAGDAWTRADRKSVV